jgi:hypothetical protein
MKIGCLFRTPGPAPQAISRMGLAQRLRLLSTRLSWGHPRPRQRRCALRTPAFHGRWRPQCHSDEADEVSGPSVYPFAIRCLLCAVRCEHKPSFEFWGVQPPPDPTRRLLKGGTQVSGAMRLRGEDCGASTAGRNVLRQAQVRAESLLPSSRAYRMTAACLPTVRTGSRRIHPAGLCCNQSEVTQVT